MFVKVLVVLTVIICSAWSQRSKNIDDLLNTCLQGINHKSSPGPEAALYSQCKPWEKRSCCSHNTTRDMHVANLYNFDFDHCHKLSTDCKRHFTQDFCFFECSPNVGPWVQKVNMTSRKERFVGVPLCRSDCEAWFNSCRYDFTCAKNWLNDFKWRNGKNYCQNNTFCYTFEQIFDTADEFCEKVWDSSWKVVSDDQSCMRLWFDPTHGNPNNLVARLRAEEIINSASSFITPYLTTLLFINYYFIIYII